MDLTDNLEREVQALVSHANRRSYRRPGKEQP